MTIQSTDIEKALDELISNEEGMKFQRLAVVLAKLRWPEFVACERKKDLGLDAYASASLAVDRIGKGLACSLTATLNKIKKDAISVKKNFDDINILIFATPGKVTKQTERVWADEVRKTFDYELVVMSREDIVTSLLAPSNASICRSHLGIPVLNEPAVEQLISATLDAKPAALSAYTSKILRETNNIDYRGLSRVNQRGSIAALPFDKVYITPRLIQQRATPEAHARQEHLLKQIVGSQAATIEEREQIEEEYAHLARSRWKPSPGHNSDGAAVGEVLKQARHLVVLGDPGIGKSSLSRFITRVYAQGESVMLKQFGWSEALIPILVRIADFADELMRQPNQTLAEFISLLMMGIGGDALRRAISERVAQGSVIIILEGMDEVPGYRERIRIVRAVEYFINDFAGNRFLITSRPSGYIPLSGTISHYSLLSFSLNQVREYITAWYYALAHRNEETPDLERSYNRTIELFNEIGRNQKLLEFSTNPLLLTLIILISEQGIRLPTRRVRLYQLAVDLLMEFWSYWRSEGRPMEMTEQLSLKQLIQVWAAVAVWAHRERPTGVLHRAVLVREVERIIQAKGLNAAGICANVDAYLDAAANRAGILEERAPDLFAFWHPIFEEYLAAVEFCSPPETTADRLLPLRNEPRWREVILLAVAYIGTVQQAESIASGLIEAIADREPDPIWEPLLHSNLRLAAACIADGFALHRRVVEQMIIRLSEAIQILPYEPLIESFVGTIQKLDDLKLTPETIEAISPLACHSNKFVRREATRLFANVAATNRVAKEWCLVMFDDPYYEVKYYAALGLVRAGDHQYEIWRTLMSFGVSIGVNSELRRYLSQGDEQAAAALRQCLDSEYQKIRFLAMRFLIEMNRVDEKVITALIQSLALEDVFDLEICQRLLVNLIIRDHSLLEKLYCYLTDQQDALRLGVASFLYKQGIREDRVIETIDSCLESSDLNVKWMAAKLLWEYGRRNQKVKEAASSCLESESVTLRGAAAETLRKMGYAEDAVVKSQLWCLSQPDPINAAQRLLGMGRERQKVIVALRSRLTDDDYLVRVKAASLLVEYGEKDEDVLESLRSCLWCDHYPARFYAWWEMNELGMSEEILEALVKKLAVQHPFWKKEARNSIDSFVERSHLTSTEIEKDLLLLLGDEDERVRCTAAELLLDWGLATDQSLRAIVGLIISASENELAETQRVLQPLSIEDGVQLLDLVKKSEGDSITQSDARALLYKWLWRYRQLSARCANDDCQGIA